MADADHSRTLELVDDRALERAGEDRLRHQDVAEELAQVLGTVRSPASIALYGPWGSGKSGLANLLKAELAESLPNSRFVRFDAFKYAETPLRRHFISQVAQALGVSDDKYRDGLYRTEDTTKIKIPGAQFLRLLAVFFAALLAVEVIALGIVVLLAALSDGPFGDRFDELADSGLALALAPAGLLAAFIALAGQTLPIKRSTSAPSSDEQFEALFQELVGKAKAEPLVIFIDELDRCSAKEVVATLEAIRTFLDVKGVLYVVAADQQVLERALRDAARQTTPADVVNPYYSAGSAYLDKIFQYQLSLPPLMPRRLSGFALEAIEDLGGLWDEIDREEVVTVLIPTHVRSPRRVKRLLNAFVVTYRLARRRADAGRLEGSLTERATEIAKLVCLQVEFPLFAADLFLDARLPQYVLTVRESGLQALPVTLPAEVRERAEGFALERLAVDEVLVRGGAAAAEDEPADDAAADDVDVDVNGEGPDVDGANRQSPSTEEQSTATRARQAVHRHHAAQLIRYLQKTAHVDGPGRDLIHLESGGAMFGLDAAVADRLESLAVDGERGSVRRLVAGFADRDQQRSALRLLAQRGKEASVGIEGRNVISCLLAVLSGPPELDVDEIADELADAVAAHEERYDLRPEDLLGALSLGTRSSRAVGSRLIGRVVPRSEAVDTELGLRVLDVSDQLDRDARGRLGEVAAAQLLDRPELAVEHLLTLGDDVLQPIVASSLAPFIERLAAERAAKAEAGDG